MVDIILGSLLVILFFVGVLVGRFIRFGWSFIKGKLENKDRKV